MKKGGEGDIKLAVYASIAPARTHTLDEIAGIMGVTRERVRQIEAEALKKLRFHLGVFLKSDKITKEDILQILQIVDMGNHVYGSSETISR